jgi:7-cyano-7-deazaguanine synthase
MSSSGHTPPSLRPNVVLCSGGIDSATVAWQVVSVGQAPELLFVDYSQPAREAERRAAGAIAERLEAPLRTIHVEGIRVPAQGEIALRNALLVTAAAAAAPTAATIVIGVHAGTGYGDCSHEFVNLMQSVLDFHTADSMRLVAPFISYHKPDVVALAARLGVPVELTHSCEAADEPCGTCSSCLDRKAFLAV